MSSTCAGIKGIFDGASFVFFSFIGFDCVSTLAEDVKKPSRDMPIGIVGCIVLVTVIYTAMVRTSVLLLSARPSAFRVQAWPGCPRRL